MAESRWLPIAAGVGIFLFLFGLLPPAKIPLWVVNLAGVSAEDASDAHGGVELTFRVEIDLDVDPDDAVLQVVDVLRRRVDARGIDGASVFREDDRVIVRLPGVTDEEARRLREMLTRVGRLEFRIAQPDAAATHLAVERARFEGRAVMDDGWYTYDGTLQEDRYFTAPTRAELEGFLDRFADDSVYFGYEHVTGPDYAGEAMREAPAEHWRSYALRRSPYLGSDAIDDAELSVDELAQRPQVTVRFTGAGADAFERMTDEFAGHKLAIVLDGEIRSAPVIQERIPGGTAVVSLGSGESYETIEARARDLVAVLRAGALRSPLVLDDERVIPPGLSDAGVWTARALFALMIGVLVGAAAFAAQLAAARFRR